MRSVVLLVILNFFISYAMEIDQIQQSYSTKLNVEINKDYFLNIDFVKNLEKTIKSYTGEIINRVDPQIWQIRFESFEFCEKAFKKLLKIKGVDSVTHID
ncbi:hypothetical protein M1446_05245 [Candidatus Dependentiae bacterium]|nr:hypothetical protein [Candidatus Dependentiae bacterium]